MIAVVGIFLSSCGGDSGSNEIADPGNGADNDTSDTDTTMVDSMVTELRYDMIEVAGLMTTGDFDDDGFTDVVFTVRTLQGFPGGQNIDMFRVAYGDSAGSFSEHTDIVRLGSSDGTKQGHTLIAVDLDGDMVDDFAYASGNVLEAFAGDAGRSHAALYRTSTVTRVVGQPLYALDADSDGDMDLVTAHQGLRLQHNDAGAFVTTEILDSPLLSPINFVTGDFTGDDIADVLAIGQPGINSVALGLYIGDGDDLNIPDALDSLSNDLFLGGFSFDTASKELAAGDFDGDNDLDIAITSTTSFLQVMINNGFGRFTPGQRVTVGEGPIHVRVADFDNDGMLDLLSINQNSKTVGISTGNGDGTFSDATGAGGGSHSILLNNDFDFFDTDVADIDGDGFVDVILAEDGSNPQDSGRGSIQFLFAPGR